MTNLLLTILLSTNTQITKISACNTTNTHIYSIWQTDDIGLPATNWNRDVIFNGSVTGTNNYYGHTVSNRFYILVDEGTVF